MFSTEIVPRVANHQVVFSREADARSCLDRKPCGAPGVGRHLRRPPWPRQALRTGCCGIASREGTEGTPLGGKNRPKDGASLRCCCLSSKTYLHNNIPTHLNWLIENTCFTSRAANSPLPPSHGDTGGCFPLVPGCKFIRIFPSLSCALDAG